MNSRLCNTRHWPLLLALTLAPGAAAAQDCTAYPLHAVEDGDTLVVLHDGEQVRIQLRGIDAPEDAANPKFARDLKRTQLPEDKLLALGRAATAHLKGLAGADGKVRLLADLSRQDRYGRTPATAFNEEGRNLGEAMVGDGYAVTLARTELDEDARQRLLDLEDRAAQNRLGLWGGEYANAFRAWRRAE